MPRARTPHDRPLRVVRVGATLAGVALAACTSFHYASGGGDAGGDATPTHDANDAVDARSRDASADGAHATGSGSGSGTGSGTGAATDAGVDTTNDATVDGGADAVAEAGTENGLSPLYVPPAADAAPCSPIGYGPNAGCSVGDCIPSAPDAGQCQGCSAQFNSDCGGHASTPCTAATDCDQGWLCYDGACHLSCLLSQPQTCGGGTAHPCTNIGNTTMGVCAN